MVGPSRLGLSSYDPYVVSRETVRAILLNTSVLRHTQCDHLEHRDLAGERNTQPLKTLLLLTVEIIASKR
jgi:hypothetical protein